MQDEPEDQAPDPQDEHDAMPEEMKRHMMAAFAHKAGLGPHPGKYQGPTEPHEQKDEGGEPSESDLQHAHEMGYTKMKDAAQGLGLTPFDRQEIEQKNAIQTQQAVQGAQAAQAAQAAQVPNQPPPAPSGPVGTTQPYPAQTRPQGPPDVTPMPPAEQEQGQAGQVGGQ